MTFAIINAITAILVLLSFIRQIFVIVISEWLNCYIVISSPEGEEKGEGSNIAIEQYSHGK